MAGQRNKNAFKILLQLLILSQKHLLDVKKVVWCGLDVVWGVLGWFGVFPRTRASVMCICRVGTPKVTAMTKRTTCTVWISLKRY